MRAAAPGYRAAMRDEETYDRVWTVEWAHQGGPGGGPEIPSQVRDDVRDLAAALGAVLDDAYDDRHDDLGGGKPDHYVWRFVFRVPDTTEPTAPAEERYRRSDYWPIEPRYWPPALAQLAGHVAGHASKLIGAGTLEVDFSPSATRHARVSDALGRTYSRELAAIEVALQPFRDAYVSKSGRPLPDHYIEAFDGANGAGIGRAVFYVGEIAYQPQKPGTAEEAHLWRVVTAGLVAERHPRLPALSQAGPALSIPPPAEHPDGPWLLTLSGGPPGAEPAGEFSGPLPQALAQLTERLRSIGQ